MPVKVLDLVSNELLFDLRLRINPVEITNERAVRGAFNTYFDEIRNIVEHEQLG